MDRRPAVRDLGKTTGKYVQSMGWRSVNNHVNISLVNKYIYFEVPKAGCGTMKSTLGGLEAARFNESLVELVQDNPHQRKNATPFIKPYQLPNDELEDVLTSRKFTRFAVVREPASRLLSSQTSSMWCVHFLRVSKIHIGAAKQITSDLICLSSMR